MRIYRRARKCSVFLSGERKLFCWICTYYLESICECNTKKCEYRTFTYGNIGISKVYVGWTSYPIGVQKQITNIISSRQEDIISIRAEGVSYRSPRQRYHILKTAYHITPRVSYQAMREVISYRLRSGISARAIRAVSYPYIRALMYRELAYRRIVVSPYLNPAQKIAFS